jgi:hypothetical protein
MSQPASKHLADPGPWLTDPDRVSAHLVFLGTEVTDVALTTEGRTLHGGADMPSYERQIPFTPHDAYGGQLELPLQGMPARLEYAAHGVSYRFDATMAGVDERGRWLVNAPARIETTDRRLVHRHSTLGDPAFELELDGAWQPPGFRIFSLLDISTDGLGVVFDPYRTPMKPGDLVSSRLLLPTAFTFMQVVLRVANVRPFRSGSNLRAAGTRFVDLPIERRKTLALSISVWQERRKVA